MYYRLFTIKKQYLSDGVKFGDRVEIKVTTKAEIEARKRKRRYTICDGKKEIVFENEHSRICKDCMDELRTREDETL
jgi:antitoxin component of MazEF toxin-antitoxin module